MKSIKNIFFKKETRSEIDKKTKKQIWEFSLKNGKRPANSKCASKEEKRLWYQLYRYTNPLDDKRYDRDFAKKYNQQFPSRFSKKKNIKEILKWSKKHNRRPSRYSGDKKERRLGYLLYNYTTSYTGCYDHEFTVDLNKKYKKLGKPRKIKYTFSAPIKNIDTGEVFDAMKDAAKKYGVSVSDIYYAIQDPEKRTSAGYKWKYR